MAEKGETKIIGIFTICVILISIGFSGCVEDDDGKNEVKYTFELYVEIENNYSDNYLILPFPVYRNRTNDVLMKKLTDLKYEYNNESTPYGIGINLTLNNKINISFNDKSNDEMFQYEFSMLNNSISYKIGDYWIYSTCNCTIFYHFTVEDDIAYFSYKIESQLSTGWQIIKGRVFRVRD
jgi:hypothetical protein